jgi:hypothetical protein
MGPRLAAMIKVRLESRDGWLAVALFWEALSSLMMSLLAEGQGLEIPG